MTSSANFMELHIWEKSSGTLQSFMTSIMENVNNCAKNFFCSNLFGA